MVRGIAGDTKHRARVAIAAVLALVCLVGLPGAAFAWDVSLGSGTAYVRRGSTDATDNMTAISYWGYKGGSEATAAYPITSPTSFASSYSIAMGAASDFSFVARAGGGRLQAARVCLTASPNTTHVFAPLTWDGALVTTETVAQLVSLVQTRAVSIEGTVSVTGTVPVSIGDTISVESSVATMPVSVASFGPLDPDALSLAVGMGAVLLGAGAFHYFGGRHV